LSVGRWLILRNKEADMNIHHAQHVLRAYQRSAWVCGLMLILALASLPACNTALAPAANLSPTAIPDERTLTIFAAASLTDAFQEIGDSFKARNAGVDLALNFAGSQQLVQQLAQGARADVLASASLKAMQAAAEAGTVNKADSQVFARNQLVVVFPKDNPAGLTRLQDLAKPGLKLVLAAKEVPAGQYALEFLDKASQDPAFDSDFKEKVLNNVVSYETNVRSVLSKVALGEADAGIVYVTDFNTAKDAISALEIPEALNAIATYLIAPVKGSIQVELSQKFIDFVLSADGQQILSSYGFLSPR